MKLFLVALAILGTVGCERAPDSVGPDTDTESKQAASARAPVVDAISDASHDGGRTVERPEVLSFKGVEHLPDTHPCHDDATVVWVNDDREPDPGFGIRTLGSLRENPDTSWTHFGPRTVRGKRWTDDSGEQMLVVCDLQGTGFRSLESDDSERQRQYLVRMGVPRDVESASFVIGDCGECSDVEQTLVHWLSRPNGESEWHTDHFEERWSNNDEGNNDQYLARSWIMAADDSDGDGIVETDVLMVGDCQPFHDETCPEVDRLWVPFTIRMIDRSGSDMNVAHTSLDPSGRLLSRNAEVASRYVDKARAIIRESEKLR